MFVSVLLPGGHCRTVFKIYTVKLGNTAICKSVNNRARRSVHSSLGKNETGIKGKITGKVNIYFVTH